jgi:hypothetical protein
MGGVNMARKPIPKSVRFEVFKRDSFRCQYCGAAAPDVILEVDHIKPVSKGGTNDIMNLVTACRDCNRGKSDRVLSDKSMVEVQRQQLEAQQERREQLEMMLKWRDELETEMEIQIDAVENIFIKYTDFGFSETGRINTRRLIKRFGINEVLEAAEISLERYYMKYPRSWETAFSKIGGICYNRKKAREEDA